VTADRQRSKNRRDAVSKKRAESYHFDMIQRAGKKNPAIETRISAILAEVEPMLRIEHCKLELVEFAPESGRATLRIDGGCPDCQVSPATFSPAIQAHIRMRVPEVREVIISA
jgi:Fe-S cluster biogenesis protein NfuA